MNISILTEIEVTQEDIDQGTPGDPRCCPIAKALRRQTNGEDWRVSAIFARRWVGEECFDIIMRLPPIASQFIFRYDNSIFSNFTPFKFRPETVEEIGNIFG